MDGFRLTKRQISIKSFRNLYFSLGCKLAGDCAPRGHTKWNTIGQCNLGDWGALPGQQHIAMIDQCQKGANNHGGQKRFRWRAVAKDQPAQRRAFTYG